MIILVLQPHCDDAAFSIHGLLESISDTNQILLVNVYSISDHAPNIGPSDVQEITSIRRDEDLSWFRSLGLSGVRYDLGLPEAPLRGLRNFVEDIEQVADVLPELSDTSDAIVLAPYGLSGNIDHGAVRGAAELVYGLDRLVLYEDLPGAAHARIEEVQSRAKVQRRSRVFPISVSSKRQAVAKYASQLQTEWEERIFGHAEALGGERVWASNEETLFSLWMAVG